MRHYKFSFIFFVAAILLLSCQENVDTVIKKNIEVRGGEDNFRNIRTVSMKMSLNTLGMEVPIRIFVSLPGSIRTEMNVNGQSIITVLNENNAWATVDGNFTPLDDGAVKDLQKNLQSQLNYFKSELFDYKKQGAVIKGFTKENFKGKPAIKIRLDYPDGITSFLFIDQKTYLNLATRTEKQVNGQLMQTETVYKNYRLVDGLMVPFSIEVNSGAMTIATMRMDSLIFNKSIDKAMFRL